MLASINPPRMLRQRMEHCWPTLRSIVLRERGYKSTLASNLGILTTHILDRAMLVPVLYPSGYGGCRLLQTYEAPRMVAGR